MRVERQPEKLPMRLIKPLAVLMLSKRNSTKRVVNVLAVVGLG